MAEKSGDIFNTSGLAYPGSQPAGFLNEQKYTVPANKLAFVTSLNLYVYYAGSTYGDGTEFYSVQVGDMLIHERWRSYGDYTLQDPAEAAFRNRLYWLNYAGGNYINTDVHTTAPAGRDEHWNFVFIKPMRLSAGNTIKVTSFHRGAGNWPVNYTYSGTEVDV